MSKRTDPKADRLLKIAQKTLLRGDTETAKEIAVMAMSTEDAVHALDRLLPRVQEADPEALELSDEQVAKVMACARELEGKNEKRIAVQILAKLERLEVKKKLRRK